MQIERSHLAILREVDRLGTVTAAAQQLCLTQSALSHAIKKLEEQIGCKLWQKQGRQLILTPAGREILALANRLLPQIEQTEHRLQQIARGERGRLRIGIECHPCYQWLQRVLQPFLLQWPGVELELDQSAQFGGIGALLHHEIDMLITPDPLFKTGLVFEPVFAYELVLVVAKSHALAAKKRVEPEQLVSEVLYTHPVERARLDVFSRFFAPAQCEPRQHKCMESSELILQMVAAGRGVTALPAWQAVLWEQQLSLKLLPLGSEGIHKQIYLGTRHEDQSVSYLRSFVELAKYGEPLSELPA